MELLRVEIEEPGRRVRTDQGFRVRATVRSRAAVEHLRLALTIQRPNGATTGWRAAICFGNPLVERVGDGAPPRAVR